MVRRRVGSTHPDTVHSFTDSDSEFSTTSPSTSASVSHHHDDERLFSVWSLSTYFFHYGVFVARHPMWFIIGAPLVMCLLGIGLVAMKEETDAEVQYAPVNNLAAVEREYWRGYFGGSSSSFQQIVATASKRGDEVLTVDALLELLDLHNRILDEVTVKDGGETLRYADICLRHPASGFCLAPSVLEFWGFNEAAIEAGNLYDTIANTDPNSIWPPTRVAPTTDKQIKNADFSYDRIEAVTMTYLVNAAELDVAREWEIAFLKFMADSTGSGDVALTYHSEESVNYELDRATAGDIIFMVITFTVMIVFSSIVMCSRDTVHNQALLSFVGVAAVCLGILGALGTGAILGQRFVPLVSIMPFLILGIGVDDMFVLSAAYNRADPNLPLEKRLGITLEEAGAAIFVTSVTDALAFLIATASVFRAVRWFAAYSSLAIVFVFIMQVTLFAAVLSYDGRRQKAHRHPLICCYVVPEGECCTTDEPADPTELGLTWFMKEYYAPFLMRDAVRVAVVVVFFALFGVSLYGTSQLKQGLDLVDLVPDDSYMVPLFENVYEYFNFGPTVEVIITRDNDVSNLKTLDEILDVQARLVHSPATTDAEIYSWVAAWRDWLVDTKNVTQQSDIPDDFSDWLLEFVDDVPEFNSDLIITAGGEYVASRFVVEQAAAPPVGLENGDNMVAIREQVYNETWVELVPNGGAQWIFFEQYNSILPETIKNLLIAVVAVTIVANFFLANVTVSFLVVLGVIMIDVDVLGMMSFWDIRLDSISLITLLMAIGFSVDALSHVAHSYVFCQEKGKAAVVVALTNMGKSVLAGNLSSLLGVSVLGAASSVIFRTFFRMFFLIILFAILHGLVLLPVLLSFHGDLFDREPSESIDKESEGDSEDVSERSSGEESVRGAYGVDGLDSSSSGSV